MKFYLSLIIHLSIVITIDAFFGYPPSRNFEDNEKANESDPINSRSVYLKKIVQRLDNFDLQCQNTFKQRYYRNDEFFEPGGPIFIFVGAEEEIVPEWLEAGFMYDMAEKHKGQLLYPEHRYYGKTKPTPDASVANLKYLSAEQALADLAHFITQMKKESGKENSKVILIGSSYAGTLAVWFRQKYPHLVDGVWASSAPLLAKANLYEYNEIAGKAIRDIGGEQCYRLIENAIKAAEKLIVQKKYDRFVELFQLCAEFEGDNYYDRAAVFCSFSDLLNGLVQYDSGEDIKNICNSLIDNDKPNDLEKFAASYREYMTGGDKYCIEADYMATIKYFMETKWRTEALRNGDRQWIYQTCSQFGFFQTSDSTSQPFGSMISLDLFTQACEDIFGSDLFTNKTIHNNIKRTNELYGGLNPRVERVYFTHGSLDPWRSTGMYSDLNSYSPTDIIANMSHSQDLYSKSSNDSLQMAAVKDRAERLIDFWLSDGRPAPGA